MPTAFTVLPAIDLLAGRAVRLKQGRRSDVTDYGDPLERVAQFQSAGATWIHIVDLSAAFDDDTAPNATTLKNLSDAAHRRGVQLELGGGLRTSERVAAAIDTGFDRVILGTAVVEQPEWATAMIEKYPGRVLLGLDARDGLVATRGWNDSAMLTPAEAAQRYRGSPVAGIVFTDISRDGIGAGVNVTSTRALAITSGLPVYASGGARTLDDIRALLAARADGVAGVICGRAIYDGTLDLAAALVLAASAANVE